jgi:hypothetical protein
MPAVLRVLLISVIAVVPALGQDRPDLSGSWVATSDAPPDLTAAPAPVLGTRLWLRQSGDTLTMVRMIRDVPVSMTMTLDGRAARNRTPGALCRGDSESIETASWDGDAVALTVVGSIPAGGGPPAKLDVRRTLRLQSRDQLLVQTATPDAASGATRGVGTLYRRVTDAPPVEQDSTVRPAAATVAQAAWLAGVWTGASGTLTVEERWTPPSGGSMLAIVRTMRGGAMTGFEFVCITEREGGLVYTAMPNGRTPPTDFRLTQVTADSLTFENPAHDFPTRIRYTRLPDGSLETLVSGKGNEKPERVLLKRE